MTNIGCNPSLSAPSPPRGGRGRLAPWCAPGLAAALMVAALGCREDAESPTAPTSPAEPGGPAFRHTAGHKVVNSLADPGNGTCNATQCTLREAINDPGSTEVSFAPGLSGTITLARPGAGGGTLLIEKGLTITGPSGGIIIQRRSTDPAFRIFRVGSGVTVRLRNLTIRGGQPPGPVTNSAGGVVNFGTLTLANCTVAGNAVAGISNHSGTLTLRNCTVARNAGNGIFNHQGTLTITNSTVTRNSGSGIADRGGTVAVTHSTLSENAFGGFVSFAGDATLTEARIVANGGGIGTTSAGVILINSTVARNLGSGIDASRGSAIFIDGSTLVGNSADQGGGIRIRTNLRANIFVTLRNSTVSGNSAREGGGIYSSGSEDAPAEVTLTNSTVAFNSASERGGGLWNVNDFSSGVVRLTNSLVAGNSAPTGPDVLGETFIARFSLIGDGTGGNITNTDGNQVGNVPPNTSPIDPRLGPLALNGGPTRTHALLVGSPAIDAASTPECPTTDQRGVPRPQGAACDIGSYERE